MPAPTRWECPDCQTDNVAAARYCEVCGGERLSATARVVVDPEGWRCTWLTDGRRCWLPGTSGAKAARCTWHTFDPRVIGNFEEFDRWGTRLRAASYCADWTHEPIPGLWHAVRGEAPLPAQPTHPCLASSCSDAARLQRRAAAGAGREP